ncbi:hypothetical protein Nepgr_020433 [Nepenthes gracilis]|uniref:Uncharacterized protein n=1 Tax=Nepenthes gracilis TaxID=150966 RepID=A0AAD3SX03_NEPGR|nr:hypothetical protein Nepgr_020433 [Nepenthes gracilis]
MFMLSPLLMMLAERSEQGAVLFGCQQNVAETLVCEAGSELSKLPGRTPLVRGMADGSEIPQQLAVLLVFARNAMAVFVSKLNSGSLLMVRGAEDTFSSPLEVLWCKMEPGTKPCQEKSEKVAQRNLRVPLAQKPLHSRLNANSASEAAFR